jgi:hypothetical protein
MGAAAMVAHLARISPFRQRIKDQGMKPTEEVQLVWRSLASMNYETELMDAALMRR